jgi:hypothetical protein
MGRSLEQRLEGLDAAAQEVEVVRVERRADLFGDRLEAGQR